MYFVSMRTCRKSSKRDWLVSYNTQERLRCYVSGGLHSYKSTCSNEPCYTRATTNICPGLTLRAYFRTQVVKMQANHLSQTILAFPQPPLTGRHVVRPLVDSYVGQKFEGQSIHLTNSLHLQPLVSLPLHPIPHSSLALPSSMTQNQNGPGNPHGQNHIRGCRSSKMEYRYSEASLQYRAIPWRSRFGHCP